MTYRVAPKTMTIFGDTIFTPRLKIRRMKLDDIHQIVQWSNDPQAHGEFLSPEYLSESICQERFESGMTWKDKNKFFIIETQDSEPIGTIRYWLRPEREECAVGQIKIARPEKRSKGFGTEAQKYLVINLFKRLKVAEIEMYTDVNNQAQQRCLTKLGFEQVDAVAYQDQQITRFGYLYRLTRERFNQYPIYQYHYV